MNRLAKILAGGALIATTALPATAFDMSAMTEAEREAFRAEIRAYLMENPEVLLEAIEVLEVRKEEAQAQADIELVSRFSEQLFNDDFSYIGGNPDGDITIVEFLDYKCGFCKRAHPEVAELLETDGNIRWVVKEFPILGEESLLASRFAIAVKAVEGDEAYAQTHDELMLMRAPITEQSLSDLSEQLGYNTKAVFDEMNSEATRAIIAENRQLAQALNINGTPSFVFGDEMVRGFVPLDGMREIVAGAREGG